MFVCLFVYQEAIEKKEKRARRFHFRCEETVAQRNVCLDKEALRKGMTQRVGGLFTSAPRLVDAVFFFCGAQPSPDCGWRPSM